MPRFQTAYARREAMGTYFEVFLAGDDVEHLEAVAAATLDEVRRLEQLLSRFDPASEISRINREAGQRCVRVDYEVWDILCLCRDWCRATNGFFDATAATAGGAGDVHNEALILDAERRTVLFGRPGAAIDLGGFGKGYALDRAGEIVRRFGVASALLNGGTSSLLAVGHHPEGSPWPVAARDPLNNDAAAPLPTILLTEQGFSCSAAFAPAELASDVIDPHSGQALTEQAACVVLTPTALEAEILSTALLCMGKAHAREYLQRCARPGCAVGWITTAAGRSRLEWLREMQ